MSLIHAQHRHTVGLMDQQRGVHAHNEDAALLRDRVESIRASLVIADSHAASERIHRRVQGQVLWSGVIVLCPSEWVMR